tara:strand:+ start:564 stop:791 length:228 start_codon:yes stop_codon:yes gene_type:complete
MSNYKIHRTLSGINNPQKSLNKISLHQAHINTQRYFRKAGIVFFTGSVVISLGLIYTNDISNNKSWKVAFPRLPK